MSLISAGSISLDCTFKLGFLRHFPYQVVTNFHGGSVERSLIKAKFIIYMYLDKACLSVVSEFELGSNSRCGQGEMDLLSP
jgi:hypothetical protein